MVRPLSELAGLVVSESKAMTGMKHAIEIDGHVYVSPAMMSLLDTDFMATMQSLKVLKLKKVKELSFWRSRVKEP